jgi:hypothetical protein
MNEMDDQLEDEREENFNEDDHDDSGDDDNLNALMPNDNSSRHNSTSRFRSSPSSKDYDRNSGTDYNDKSTGWSKHPRKKEDIICKYLLLDNKCADMSCPYNHSPQIMREERERIQKLWSAPRPFTSNPKIRPPPNRPPNLDGDFNVIQSLLRVYQTNQYWRAANKEAKVKAKDKDDLILSNVMTLFDTGASSGNFVSKAFIEKHGLQDQLQNNAFHRI